MQSKFKRFQISETLYWVPKSGLFGSITDSDEVLEHLLTKL